MKKKEIFQQIQKTLNGVQNYKNSKIVEDQLIIEFQIEGAKCKTSIRCQHFGKIYLVNPPVNKLLIENFENEFETVLFDDVKKFYNNDFTLCVGSGQLDLNSLLPEYRIESEKDCIEYCEKFKNHIKEVINIFFYPMSDITNIGKYVAKFDYVDNLKVLVGGKFPVHTLKKIFLLKKGNQIERYLEYKKGFEEQIESFSIRKPNRKDEAKIFMDNYISLVRKLEEENTFP